MPLFIRTRFAVAALAGAIAIFSPAHADNVAQTLPYSQNWTNIALINTANDWSAVPGIIGYRGDNLNAGTGIDAQTMTADDSPGVVNVIQNVTTPNTNVTGGVAEIEVADPAIALQGSGTADAPYILVHLNTTGRTVIQVAYNARDMDGSADNAVQQLALLYRVGSTGPFTNVPTAYVADGTTAGTATQTTAVSATLPVNAENQPLVQLRIITTNAVGNDEWIGIDDINVTGTVPTPVLSIAAAPTIAEGNPGCTVGTNKLTYAVTATPAPASPLAFTVALSGTATGVDIGTAVIGNVQTNGTGFVDVPVNCDLQIEGDETVIVTLQDDVAYDVSGANGSASGTITNDDVGVIRIASVAQAEGTGANSTFAFNVTLDGGVLAGTGGVTMNYEIVSAGGTPATANVDFTEVLAATHTIPEGANSAAINATVVADSDDESNETFAVNLSNPGNATLGDNQAIGTIQDDDDLVPTISIGDVTAVETNSATTTFTFAVTLSSPAPAGGVTFDLDTSDGSATLANSDYQLLSVDGATIAAGASSANFNVLVNGDTSVESDEVFNVTITNPTNVAASGNDLAATGTIQNDDFVTTLSVANPAPFTEGNSGSSNVTVVVSADRVPTHPITFTHATTALTATAGVDFTGGTVTGVTFDSTNCAAGPALPCSRDISIPVIGDLTSEPDETFRVTISAVAGTNAALGTAIATVTIANDDVVTEIAAIQGSGFASPLNTQVHTVNNAVVTGLLPNGFFIQDPIPDALQHTSDAMFVYTATNPASAPYSLVLGDSVNVRGTVIEAAMTTPPGQPNYSNATKFSDAGLLVQRIGSNAPLPPPIVFDATTPSPNPANPTCAAGTWTGSDTTETRNFECMESMRVTTTSGMINLGAQSFTTPPSNDPIAEIRITTSGSRAFREGGVSRVTAIINETPPALTPPAPPLVPGYVFDDNPEVFELDLDRFGLANYAVTPGTLFQATGVLAAEFGDYELFPQSFTELQSVPPLPAPVPAASDTQLTIGSQNLHLLYDTINDPWNTSDCDGTPDPDTCPNQAQFDAKLSLLSRQIREQLNSPMVIGHQEIEKLAALQALATKVNSDLGPNPPFTYTAHVGAIDDLDGGHQNVGYLIRSDVTVQSLTQLNTTQTWVFNTVDQGEVMDRPPYLLRASVQRSGAPFEFAVMVLHLRSLSGIDDLSPAADHIDAHRVRQKRLYQAALTAQAIQQFQTANPSVPLYVIGDVNAFPESDGYADVVGILKGTTDPALSEYDLDFFNLQGPGPNGNIVTPVLTAASLLAPFNERYSFSFNNTPQQIDHAFMTDAALARFEDIMFTRGNVDKQSLYQIGSTNPLVSSDHDGFVLYIDAAQDGLFSDGFED